MFDVGFWELIAVLAIGLLVLGPERLSQVVRTAGKWLGRARAMARNMQYELEREVSLTDFDNKQTIAKPAAKESASTAQPDAPDAAAVTASEPVPTASDER